MSDPSSYTKLPAHIVRDACKKAIEHIESTRQNNDKQTIAGLLEDKTWRWMRLWRFVGFKRPTTESVLEELLKDDWSFIYYGYPSLYLDYAYKTAQRLLVVAEKSLIGDLKEVTICDEHLLDLQEWL